MMAGQLVPVSRPKACASGEDFSLTALNHVSHTYSSSASAFLPAAAAALFLALSSVSMRAAAPQQIIPLGQFPPPSGKVAPSQPTLNPLQTPTLSPGVLTLLELEGRFSQAVLDGGGKAFTEWFAEDGITLNNRRPAVLGRNNIAGEANWNPAEYQLSWIPEGAQMGPSNDMGFSWGHYEGHAKDKNGEPVVTSGRYITVWKKLPNGQWKVALDASAEEPPAAGNCCALPKP